MEKIKTGSEVCWGVKLQWEHKTFDSSVLFIYWFLLLLKKNLKKNTFYDSCSHLWQGESDSL